MLPKIVSLFSGAGGLDLGFQAAGYDLLLAIDVSPSAIKSHGRNFPGVKSIAADLVELGPNGVLDALSNIIEPNEPIGLIGGPPCQGFSRANPASDPNDPRNLLPNLYLDIVEVLQSKYSVRFVLFENVLGIKDSKHERVFSEILRRLGTLGLFERIDEFCALDFGVPQDRRRVIISAFDTPQSVSRFQPKEIPRGDLSVEKAIGEYPEPAYYSRTLSPDDIPFHPNHWTMRPRSDRFRTPSKNVPGSRSFRRLTWGAPSPTVAYGHREIHVHPEGHRRLSIYEAMTLQGFDRDFILEGTLSAQVEQVSNAVPPPMAEALANAVRVALCDSSEEEFMAGHRGT
ncbi:DNA cytosine methyltransferase [Tsukamurella ocularis]|uniref:DNA cytosine methyltransferase n=1 Tax=Tsukamurella ocularis TaxID=1970234 RepID=UPI002167A9A0|nr:DNA cytosine methyltransferase [Tsukamurella ocularis]MCS3780351.1 DNA (cytosine-5)-methyltransferase 1 [Tsukamurella ocularis]MCS3786094.1 DNA (cytosine-5)-methyltransferase 1 [Tsukamurella ocularis]MCS3849458.1 DNA (cytosine-5)-methyltransferase 1 [Tsukamurella ocularis]